MLQAVVNGISNGVTALDISEAKKNRFAAIYTDNPTDNGGCPFWIGKILEADSEHHFAEESATDCDDDSADEESGTIEEGIKVHEYEVENKGKNPSKDQRQYTPVYEEGPKRRKSTSTAARPVTTWTPLGTVGWIFDKLNTNGKIPKKDLDWIAFACEIAHRTEYHKCCGVEAFNTANGFDNIPISKTRKAGD